MSLVVAFSAFFGYDELLGSKEQKKVKKSQK
jgi:hypothetical protein